MDIYNAINQLQQRLLGRMINLGRCIEKTITGNTLTTKNQIVRIKCVNERKISLILCQN